jgi:hypothetical protein
LGALCPAQAADTDSEILPRRIIDILDWYQVLEGFPCAERLEAYFNAF